MAQVWPVSCGGFGGAALREFVMKARAASFFSFFLFPLSEGTRRCKCVLLVFFLNFSLGCEFVVVWLDWLTRIARCFRCRAEERGAMVGASAFSRLVW